MPERTITQNNIGERPHFFEDPAVDQLMAMLMAVVGELSVALDRIDSIERVLDSEGVVSRTAIEAYRPDDAVAAERSERRRTYIDRVLRIVREEKARLVSHEGMSEYRKLMDTLASQGEA